MELSKRKHLACRDLILNNAPPNVSKVIINTPSAVGGGNKAARRGLIRDRPRVRRRHFRGAQLQPFALLDGSERPALAPS